MIYIRDQSHIQLTLGWPDSTDQNLQGCKAMLVFRFLKCHARARLPERTAEEKDEQSLHLGNPWIATAAEVG